MSVILCHLADGRSRGSQLHVGSLNCLTLRQMCPGNDTVPLCHLLPRSISYIAQWWQSCSIIVPVHHVTHLDVLQIHGSVFPCCIHTAWYAFKQLGVGIRPSLFCLNWAMYQGYLTSTSLHHATNFLHKELVQDRSHVCIYCASWVRPLVAIAILGFPSSDPDGVRPVALVPRGACFTWPNSEPQAVAGMS